MTESWSLKHKIHIGFSEGDCQVYRKEDIDTLREKLIEDIDTLYDDNWSIPRGRVIDIINKRFGIE